jgi:hypothetical protein
VKVALRLVVVELSGQPLLWNVQKGEAAVNARLCLVGYELEVMAAIGRSTHLVTSFDAAWKSGFAVVVCDRKIGMSG